VDNQSEVLLPTGDYLRQLIGQSKVKPKELKGLIRNRGVFTASDDKEIIGPILIKTGLSPFEYTELRETYKTKEESQKSKTRTIGWASETPLIDSIPESIDYEALLNDHFGVYQLASAPGFTAAEGNPDHVYMDFEISRNDSIKNIGENVSLHKGRVEFKRDSETKDVKISLTHTAPETKSFGSKVSNELIRHFKEQGHIDSDEEIVTIKFSDFSNQKRVQFLNELTQKARYSLVSFVDTRDIHFAPDESVPGPPEDLAWMKDKIDDLRIKGKSLHSTFFVKDSKFHPFISLYSVACDYTFSTSNYQGSCRILFEFSEGEEVSEGSELTLNMTMLKLDVNEEGTSRATIKKAILDSLEKFKIEAYKKYKFAEGTTDSA
jgi:hypothetical protein